MVGRLPGSVLVRLVFPAQSRNGIRRMQGPARGAARRAWVEGSVDAAAGRRTAPARRAGAARRRRSTAGFGACSARGGMMRFLDTSAQAGEASVRARPSEPLTWPGTGLTACSTARARRHLPRLLHAVAELASDPNTALSAPWRPPLLQRLRLFPRRPPLRRQRATRRPRRARRRCRRCTSTTRTRGTRPRKRRALP